MSGARCAAVHCALIFPRGDGAAHSVAVCGKLQPFLPTRLIQPRDDFSRVHHRLQPLRQTLTACMLFNLFTGLVVMCHASVAATPASATTVRGHGDYRDDDDSYSFSRGADGVRHLRFAAPRALLVPTSFAASCHRHRRCHTPMQPGRCRRPHATSSCGAMQKVYRTVQ